MSVVRPLLVVRCVRWKRSAGKRGEEERGGRIGSWGGRSAGIRGEKKEKKGKEGEETTFQKTKTNLERARAAGGDDGTYAVKVNHADVV